MPLNTGLPRSVTGNFVSAALGSALLLSVTAKNEPQIKPALKKKVKIAVQSGAAAASAIAAANYIGKGKYLNAAAAVALGLGSLYMIEKLTSTKDNK